VNLGEGRPVLDHEPSVGGQLRAETVEAVAGVGLADPEQLQGRDPGRVAGKPGEEVGQHGIVEHALQLARHAGHRVQTATSGVEAEPDCGPARVGDQRGALREVGLLQVVGGHGPIAPGEEALQVGDRLCVPDEVACEGPRHRLGREVVGGRAEAPGDQQRLGATGELAQHGDQLVHVVADRGVADHREADVAEPARHRSRVGVGQSSLDQLVADGEDLDPCHSGLRPPTLTRGTTCVKRRGGVGHWP